MKNYAILYLDRENKPTQISEFHIWISPLRINKGVSYFISWKRVEILEIVTYNFNPVKEYVIIALNLPQSTPDIN